MARKACIAKQNRRQEIVKRNWDKRQGLKKRAADMTLSEEEREQARLDLHKMPRDSSKVRLRSRCALTGRPRGYLSKFKLSRLCFREMALKGEIPGVTKASW